MATKPWPVLLAIAAAVISGLFVYSCPEAEDTESGFAENAGLRRVPLGDATRAASDPGNVAGKNTEALRQAVDPPLILRGGVRWADGPPVAQARVVMIRGGITLDQAFTGSAGTYKLGFHLGKNAPQTRDGNVTLQITPPCWEKPWRGRAIIDRRGSVWTAQPVVLPAMVDVRFRVQLSAEDLELLTTYGARSLALDLLEPFPSIAWVIPKRIAEAAIPLEAADPEVTVRTPYRPVIDALLFLRRARSRELVARKRSISLGLDRVQSLEFRVDRGHILQIGVVDHLGEPLPHARVAIETPNPKLPLGHTNDLREASATGELIFFGDPLTSFLVRAKYCGVEGVVDHVNPGMQRLQVRLDLRKKLQILLRRGSRPIERFRVGNNPVLFATREPPELPHHPAGKAWIPLERDGEPDWFVLTWKDEGRYHEMVHLFSPRGARDLLVIDTGRLKLPDTGTLELHFGGRQECNVTLEQIDPPPPKTVFRRWKMVFPMGEEKVRLRGIPSGRYRIRIRKVRSWPKSPPLVELTRRFDPGNHLIHVEELMFGK